MERQLVVAMLAGNTEKYIDMSIKSFIEDVDGLVIVYDISSKDNTYKKIEEWKKKYPTKITIIKREYEHSYDIKDANSRARTVYLNYLKDNYMGHWALVLDADEVVSDNFKDIIRTGIKNIEFAGIEVVSPKMIHFIQDLAHEDSTLEQHYVPCRLFKISEDCYYTIGEHPVLSLKYETTNQKYIAWSGFTIYHLSYIPGINYYKDRYLNHLNKSEMHTKEYLQNWYYSHITGAYPKREIDITTIPKVIKDEYLIDSDYFYFKNRSQIEMKHFALVKQWWDYFKPKEVLDVGCGFGHYAYVWSWFTDVSMCDISKYAIDNTPYIGIKKCVLDISDDNLIDKNKYELVTVIDILEHLEYNKLDTALDNIKKLSKKHILFSIPFIGNPNLENDKTHIIKETREWWVRKLEDHGLNILDTPSSFLFKDQIIIGEVI
jgi:2-polyprenyl-3-methyl-5-hydroxy-6-metoxy-1,4-benzoquinol methylase